MFAIQTSHKFQSAVCMFLAAVIVSSSLAIGAFGIYSLEQRATASVVVSA
jgi:hypothetical protein